jgi:phosphoribosyl-ATP pyrophosphohydrolase/phosphoribosyl-AMP cyclohydrolase
VSGEQLRWDADGLIPAVVQETETGEVLMVAWMNREALEATLRTGGSHFWSRSRRALWRKGETSGHVQHVDGLYADCDGDTLLVQVHQEGVACHTGARTCFFTRLGGGDAPGAAGAGPATLEVVERVLQSRVAAPPPGSYVAGLLAKGEAQICRKIGEEAIEVVTAALGGEGDERGGLGDRRPLVSHHGAPRRRGIPLRRVFAELARRQGERRAADR